jgi:hypothetical protein
MIFAPDDASVVEFQLEPQLNRAYGHLAYALGLDHWLVPQIRANHRGFYSLDEKNIDALMQLLRHILTKKGYKDRLLDYQEMSDEF